MAIDFLNGWYPAKHLIFNGSGKKALTTKMLKDYLAQVWLIYTNQSYYVIVCDLTVERFPSSEVGPEVYWNPFAFLQESLAKYYWLESIRGECLYDVK